MFISQVENIQWVYCDAELYMVQKVRIKDLTVVLLSYVLFYVFGIIKSE